MIKITKQFCLIVLSVLLLSSNLKAQTPLPTMPSGGPDNGTFDKSGRYPAGSVKNIKDFYSSVAGKNVDMWVYTPPGYSTSQKYGVIYCYQGIGTDAGTIFYNWCVNSGIVCDNLIGEGKISKGVIIVAIDDQFNGNNSNVQDMTIKDAIPYIESRYSTFADADHRGVFGYSWGGGYTFNVGSKNLNYFHYLSPTAAAPNKQSDATLFPNGGATAKQVLKCLFISWGQNDYQSIIDANVACVNYCKNNNIPHFSWVAQGQGHTAGTWRPAMWNFLQLADKAGISSSKSLPIVSITAPANNSIFTSPATINLAANATDANGSISKVEFYNGTTKLGEDATSPYTYSWTNVAKGTYSITAIATDNSGNKTTSEAIAITVNVPQGPFNGTVNQIPGIIQAENFDVGGNGVAYSDADTGNTGGATFRTDEDVDLEICTDAGGGFNLGFATAGEWLEYTVNVAASGNYDLDLRVACSGTGRTLTLSMDGVAIANNVAITNTGGWQTWQTTSIKNIPLKAGQQILRLTVGSTDYLNINYLEFKKSIITQLDEEMASDLSLYPNPFGLEGIQINKPGEFIYKLTDPSGVLFDEGKSNSSIVIGKNLHPGIYILTLENEKGKVVRKIIRK